MTKTDNNSAHSPFVTVRVTPKEGLSAVVGAAVDPADLEVEGVVGALDTPVLVGVVVTFAEFAPAVIVTGTMRGLVCTPELESTCDVPALMVVSVIENVTVLVLAKVLPAWICL